MNADGRSFDQGLAVAHIWIIAKSPSKRILTSSAFSLVNGLSGIAAQLARPRGWVRIHVPIVRRNIVLGQGPHPNSNGANLCLPPKRRWTRERSFLGDAYRGAAVTLTSPLPQLSGRETGKGAAASPGPGEVLSDARIERDFAAGESANPTK